MSNNSALLKTEPEVFDDLAVIAERLGGIDNTLHAFPFRHAEDFLRGHIGIKIDPLRCLAATACPDVILHQVYGQICAQTAGKMQRLKLIVVKLSAVADENLVMLLPLCYRIVVLSDMAYGIDLLFQGSIGCLLIHIREDDFRPAPCWHADHAPLAFIVHQVAVQGMHLGHKCALPGLDLLLVDIRHHARLV